LGAAGAARSVSRATSNRSLTLGMSASIRAVFGLMCTSHGQSTTNHHFRSSTATQAGLLRLVHLPVIHIQASHSAWRDALLSGCTKPSAASLFMIGVVPITRWRTSSAKCRRSCSMGIVPRQLVVSTTLTWGSARSKSVTSGIRWKGMGARSQSECRTPSKSRKRMTSPLGIPVRSRSI